MKVLALDTSNRPLSVSVLNYDKVLATTTITTQRKHAAYAMQTIEDLVKVAKLKPSDLDRVVVAQGPGSYTGLRVAVTIGKVLSDTLKIDLVGISSLLALSLNVEKEGQLVAPTFDARNDILFTGLYRITSNGPKSVLPDQHISFEEWLKQLDQFDESIVFVGEDVANFKARLQAHFGTNFKSVVGIDNLPQAARIGIYGEQQRPVSDIDTFVPDYLRLTQAESDWQKLHPGEGHESYVEQV
ncbi:tRNA (adenosine(37)-N6)-threonylcarbamoyltransferase complex dimerization subunit type 1 TsaB [Fructilactobacillus lindneri]|uniref:Gcp-like domain-containing protein n=2 Tax=Fructilactobacillus lindneri TaxID=53444 RepID=A0A0R2JWE0_9LACO|nr:tRNA (adenosine(37)-N6)-threonylcarbamoyltransferase complex dimerization subunit type 1 TsaB [Fructilactobacillus lindneri]ANZ58477.1 tRNA threonylcarbamoyladenosine biosynthesis protein TsaB [Fructilactobacillus lindneri]ANZ59790.1 tRNA threonylcarbamoyladenosine biosynthesis protein TsaB [Fructilactobacillus lindneri]KRN79308.1 hypothetical protein IV52_GL000717 [Fructilactobacillus lindneri DSM 20690 = JCM 11027]POG98418.1 tRNA (adenosine(37)-N6)-threonylcarbamoyltransferase complex dime